MGKYNQSQSINQVIDWNHLSPGYHKNIRGKKKLASIFLSFDFAMHQNMLWKPSKLNYKCFITNILFSFALCRSFFSSVLFLLLIFLCS